MADKKVSLEVLNPTGEVLEVPVLSSSPRLSRLAGKKIGLINNTKAGGETLIPYLKEALPKHFPDINLREWKLHFSLATDLKEPIIRDIVENSDGVIALMGD